MLEGSYWGKALRNISLIQPIPTPKVSSRQGLDTSLATIEGIVLSADTARLSPFQYRRRRHTPIPTKVPSNPSRLQLQAGFGIGGRLKQALCLPRYRQSEWLRHFKVKLYFKLSALRDDSDSLLVQYRHLHLYDNNASSGFGDFTDVLQSLFD